MKRGQATMEFLMTYGWAILVVLIALASLFYLGVFDTKVPSTCNVQSPFVCKDMKVDEGGVTFLLDNLNVDSIESVNMVVNGQTCSQIRIEDEPVSQVSGIKNKEIKIQCVGLELDPESKTNVDLNFIYTSNNLDHNIVATGVGQVEEGVEYFYRPLIYPQDGLVFGWDGSSLLSYIGNFTGTAEGGLVAGNYDNLTGGHVFDTNATLFDSVDDNIDFGDVDNLDMGVSDFTLTAWIKASNNGKYTIIGKRGGGYGNSYYMGLANSDGGLSVQILNISSTCGPGRNLDLRDNKWHFVSGVFNRSGNITTYIDGVFEGTRDCTRINNNLDNSWHFEIGSFDENQPFNGSLDEIHIWKKALTGQEIQDLFILYTVE